MTRKNFLARNETRQHRQERNGASFHANDIFLIRLHARFVDLGDVRNDILGRGNNRLLLLLLPKDPQGLLLLLAQDPQRLLLLDEPQGLLNHKGQGTLLLLDHGNIRWVEDLLLLGQQLVCDGLLLLLQPGLRLLAVEVGVGVEPGWAG